MARAPASDRSSTLTPAGTLVVPGTCEGPPGTGQGGWVAGLLASRLRDGPVSVSLRRPVPLQTPLDVLDGGGTVELRDGHDVLAVAEESALDLDPPDLDLDALRRARPTTEVLEQHLAPTCIACGPRRDDGLRVLPGPLPDLDAVGCLWTVPSTGVDPDGTLPAPLVWAVLDCPGSWALLEGQPRPLEAFPALARITARVDAPLRAGTELAVVGWARSREGRRWEAGTAILAPDGTVLARARQTCVLVPLDWRDR